MLSLSFTGYLADAMAGTLLPSSYNDLAEAVEEPREDEADDEMFLGTIPVYRWRELREEDPSSHWSVLYERFYRKHGPSSLKP